MNDTAPAVVPDAIIDPADTLAALGIPPFMADMAKGLGLDLGALLDASAPDPDAPELRDVLERLDDMADTIGAVAASVERIIGALDAAGGRLRRFGIPWQT